MTRWLCIADRANAAVAKECLVWGVTARYRNTMAKVHDGDTFLIYARQEHVDGERRPSAVMGAFEVVSEPFEDATPIFAAPEFLPGEVFPVRVKLRPLPDIKDPVEFKPLVPALSFIKNKKIWSWSIRGTMRMIPEQDYQRIVRGGA